MTQAQLSGGAPPAAPAGRILELASADLDSALRAVIAAAGEPAYRVKQVREWLFRRSPDGFEGMSNLPKRLRERLAGSFVLRQLTSRVEQTSRDGTRKFLWDRAEGGAIESVLIPDGARVTYCISTQVGCPVKCTFCATGHGGFAGQLHASEIVEQVLAMRRITAQAPTNIVYMGMGEPLLNFEAVLASLEVLTSGEQVAFGARRITVSTVGVPERIRELGERFPQVKLAISLHAPDDRLRDEIIPLNRRFPLADVLRAAREHAESTRKNVTFEYILLPRVNDSQEHAETLARLLEGIPSRVNLIGFNPFPGAPYARPSVERLLEFRSWLERRYAGPVTIRRSRGDDIQGACGQLSLKHATAAG